MNELADANHNIENVNQSAERVASELADANKKLVESATEMGKAKADLNAAQDQLKLCHGKILSISIYFKLFRKIHQVQVFVFERAR